MKSVSMVFCVYSGVPLQFRRRFFASDEYDDGQTTEFQLRFGHSLRDAACRDKISTALPMKKSVRPVHVVGTTVGSAQ